MDGRKDVQDVYLSAVKVEFSKDGREFCSGVLITPYLVLTAAHCFCVQQPPAEAVVIDAHSARCVLKVSAVRAVLYGSPPDVKDSRSDNRSGARQPMDLSGRYDASVGPMEIELHPDYRSEFDRRGQLIASRADLAAIHLTQPLLGAGSPVQVPPRHEVEVGESLVAVGYGKTRPEAGQGLSGQRHYGSNKVKSVYAWADPQDREAKARDGIFVFAGEGPNGQKAHILPGDSGGPCFAQRGDGVWLVGITSMDLEAGKDMLRSSLFTSTFVHRAWINQQLEKSRARVEKLKSQSD